MAGSTTVRDGKIPGPRIPVVVHAIGATGGLNAVEFTLMVKFGMKPIDTLKTATSVDAGLLGLANRLGTHIQQTGKVLFVMRDGVIYRNDRAKGGWASN
jgi:imidazolonepropionase-like amidohydrolase